MPNFIEESNPNIMVQELSEIMGMEWEEIRAEEFDSEYIQWCESVDLETDSEEMFNYYFPLGE